MAEKKRIDSSDITVQIEQTSTSRHVVDGIATSQGRYNKPLFTTEVVYPTRRMNKNGNYNVVKSTPTDVTGWTPESGSTVTSNALIAPATGQAYINVNLKIEKLAARTTVQVAVNGDVIHQESTTGTQIAIKRVAYLNTGDAVSIRAWYQNHGSYWFWDTPYSRIIPDGSFVYFSDFPDQEIEFERDMVYGTDKGFYSDSWGQYVTPTYLKQGMPFATSIAVNVTASTKSGSATTTLSRGSVSGPILAQSRSPIPVIPGSKVNFSGTFRVRRTGTNETTESGSSTAVSVRFSLWGIGIKVDEYGVESIVPQELMMSMFTLQPSGSQDESMIEYTIPEMATPATIPADMEGMYFTCSLVHDTGSVYGAGTFTSKVTQSNGQNVPPKSTSEMRYFGWSTSNPLKINIQLPEGTQEVTEHPLSLTGVAFKDRKFFEGVDGQAELIFFGMPGQSATINVYDYTTTRGSLIGTYTAAANERKVVTINASTPKIEIDSANTYFIESIMNTEIRELNRVRTAVDDTTYTAINSDLSKISIITEEAGSGSATLDFVSEDLDPAESEIIRNGKKIRILARHYGEGNETKPSGWSGEALWTEIFCGTVKKVLSTYDYTDEPIIQVTAYNTGDKLDRIPAGVAFDSFEKYSGYLTSLGKRVSCNGRNWAGPVGNMPGKYLLNPAAHGDFSLLEGFIMTRNTNKEYFYVNAKDEIIITNQLADSGIRFSDVAGDGDLSYGKVNRKSDTDTIINQVVTNEKLLDVENYRDRDLSSDRPPEDLRYPETKSQSGTFTNIDSANEVGLMSKSFPVVRAFSTLRELYDGKIGPGFTEWAADILLTHGESFVEMRDFNVPIRTSEEIYLISKLDLLHSIEVAHKGDEQVAVIREIQHTIQPGKWFCKLGFESKDQRSYW